MPMDADPSLNRRRLRIELRKAREQSHKTQKQAARDLEWSLSKLIRIESGTVGVSVTDTRALLQLYAITDPGLVGELEDAARGSKGQAWWAQYTDMLRPPFAQLLSYEAAANSYLCFEPMLIPSVLQIPEYTDALLDPRRGPNTARAVELRMSRQERLFDDVEGEGSETEFIIGEAGLHVQIGGADVLRRQLQHVLNRCAHPRISVRVLPYSAGAHYSIASSFILLGFKEDDDLVYLEGPTGSIVSRSDLELTAEYQECFADITARSLSAEASQDVIEQAMDSLSSR